MALNTQAETFRGFGKLFQLGAQTAVECRFGNEVGTVLTTHVSASLTGADAGNGEVRYYGKAHFSIVYEDSEKRVCRAEKGVEFTARAQDDRCFPALTARVAVAVDNVSVRREGASVFVTALLGADISLYGEQNFEYLSGGDLVCRREPVNVLCAHLCGGASEAEDEFETEFIGDILLHAETVNVRNGHAPRRGRNQSLRAGAERGKLARFLRASDSFQYRNSLRGGFLRVPRGCKRYRVGRGAPRGSGRRAR